ncbi:hypothetical protein [Streptomyces turgidiscabies]|uniref:hypothetical protein n=1 Tax=Streptomyces turgidiscabies TaxID=85558 RepID=UPI0027D89D35|nr:hypothetical protein [Streptomyces turgidiscabies]
MNAVVLVSAVAALSVTAPSAHAAGTPDPAVVAALQRIQNGTWTNADAELIRGVPELAATTPDPRVAPTVTVEEIQYVVLPDGTMESTSTTGLSDADAAAAGTSDGLRQLVTPESGADTSVGDLVELPEEGTSSTAPARGVRAASGKWKWSHVTVTAHSYFGTVIYKWHRKAQFRYDGSKVTQWGSRSDSTSNEQDVVQVGARLENQKSRVPASSATSFMKRRIDLCAPAYGCYATNYPWAKIKMKGNGTTSFTSSDR